MDQRPSSPEAPLRIAALLAELEERSRSRPDRVLRLRGTLPAQDAPGGEEPFELLIFRGFSSLTTHPTAFDPDRPALPEGSAISGAELLQAPIDPDASTPLSGPRAVQDFLDPPAWS